MNWVWPIAPAQALHLLRRHVALLEDLQGGEQLVVGELRAAPFMRQGGQRADHAQAAGIAAEIAFHAPDGDHEASVDAIALFDGAQDIGMFGEQALAGEDPARRQCIVEVFPDRPAELRLAAVGADHRRIGRHVGQDAVE